MDAHPATIRIEESQPVPLSCRVSHTLGAEGPWTHVARLFPPGQAARCRLCPRQLCNVDASGLCMMSYPYYVPPQLAGLHRFVVGPGEIGDGYGGDGPAAAGGVDGRPGDG